MNKRISVISPIAFVLFGVLSFSPIATADTQLRPLVSFVGADTRIAKVDFLRITTRESWIRLWLEHQGKAGRPEDYDKYKPSGAPEIDFERCMVIAITESPGPANAGIVAVSVSEAAQDITFDYDNMQYQYREGTCAPGNAYGFFVLPLSTKPVAVRHNVQDFQSRIKRDPPVWKEVKRFDALKSPVAK